jgi:hypothetical protein
MWSETERGPVRWFVVAAAGLFLACTSRVPEPGESRADEAVPSGTEPSNAPDRPPADRTRANLEISRSIAPRLSRSREGLTSHATRTGSQRIPLEGRFRSMHVPVRAPDGQTKAQCVSSKAELDLVLEKRRP